jgi:hypothetical protein
MKWAASQPDDVLSVREGFLEMDQADYSVGDGQVVMDGWQGLLVKDNMNKILERLGAALNDELGYAFEQRFGTDVDEWRELNVLKTMKMVVAQASSRFIVGRPLCISPPTFSGDDGH